MNVKRITMTVIVMVLGLIAIDYPAFAQADTGKCKQVKGNVEVTFGPGTANGVIANGGVLNGTFSTAFTAGSIMPTADPTSVTFTGDSVIANDWGTVVTRDVYLFDTAMGLGPGLLRIDPAASTGAFAGATGVIYINPNFDDLVGHGQLGGKICLAEE